MWSLEAESGEWGRKWWVGPVLLLLKQPQERTTTGLYENSLYSQVGWSLKSSTATLSTATLGSRFQMQEALKEHKGHPNYDRRRGTHPSVLWDIVFWSLLQKGIYHIHYYSGLMLRNWLGKVSFLWCSSSSNPLRNFAWSVVFALIHLHCHFTVPVHL